MMDIKRLALLRQLLTLCVLWSVSASATWAADPAEQMNFFESQVRPLLAEKCWSCHGSEKQKGDLRLDSLSAILTGGESGSAATVGDADTSLLIQAVRYEAMEMPPSGKLSEKEIDVLVRWINQGAYWPGETATDGSNPHPSKAVRSSDSFSDEDRQWWAIQPMRQTAVPSVSLPHWPKNQLDHFVLDKMTSAGLSPAPEAERGALVRRVYFDLTGLPPTSDQVTTFLNDTASDAYERLVDQLLDSPAYGEHMARFWLDLVRYADSDGYRADGYRPDAWQYRDYVIRSFNDDKPYDRFVQEQIAGDELFPDDVDAQVALGYLRHWVYEWNIRDAPGQWKTILEDLTDTTADVFMGLGLQCAKCHNHKFDPLLQKDYYRLQAFFAPVMPVAIEVATKAEVESYREQLTHWEAKTQSIRDEIAKLESPYREKLRNAAINRFPEDIQAIARKPVEQQTPYEQQIAYLVYRQVDAEYEGLEGSMKAADKDRVLALKRELEQHTVQRPKALPKAMAVCDVGQAAPSTLIPKKSNDPIEPGIPSILDPLPLEVAPPTIGRNTTGRRTALAQWLTRKDNPLTARVIVNRLWQWHFGRGLAANTSDFGRLGEPPSHPELLDHLAIQLIEGGWRLKHLHRLMVTSATYRQSTSHPRFAEYQLVDPLNLYLWRSTTRRLQAEQIRDALLAVSGRLKQQQGGPGVNPDVPRRSVYTRVMRNSPDELMDSFDLPLFFNSNPSRNTTTTPIQSLLMINSELMLSHARNLAKAATNDARSAGATRERDTLAIKVSHAWKRAYGRVPTDDELKQSLQFVSEQTSRLIQLKSNEHPSEAVTLAKLPYRDGQAVRFDLSSADLRLQVPHQAPMSVGDFTIETFFQLRSIDQGAAVRTIVGKWSGERHTRGWSFGVTGKGSRRKPQTLVLQMVGDVLPGGTQDRAIFSDQHIEIYKPYYAAAAVTMAKDNQPGTIGFYLKDLSNDDAPLLIANIEHDVKGGISNDLPLTFGALHQGTAAFDGLVDDVRWSQGGLPVEQMLYTAEKKVAGAIGYWQFEVHPGVLKNSLSESLTIEAEGKSVVPLEPAEAAFVDFCHALLNSNEFLYLD